MSDNHIITISGKPFILYAGLLEESHNRGIKSLEVEIVQFPKAENDFTYICKATFESKNGEIFTDYVDCNPKNVGNKIIPHLIRMSSTRAKAKVMRDFSNIGICNFEELNPDEIESSSEPPSIPQLGLLKKLAI